MKVKEQYKGMESTAIWKAVIEYVASHETITTVSGLCLNVKFVGSCVFLKGGTPGTRRADKGEYLTGKDFMAAYDAVKDWDDINTGNVKPYIRRQQTPFIALLHCAGIIE